MKRTPLLLCAGLCAAGLPAGYLAKRLTSSPAAAIAGRESSAEPLSGEGLTAAGDDVPKDVAKPVTPALSTLRSDETLETLKAADETDLYRRLALWMVDASEQDIAAYWQHYRTKDKRANEINDLIFINWTRINPRGATAAAAGTPDEHYAWWAWASHDPQQALAVAMAENPDRVNNVTWGIGEFHPEWLREHFDEIPEGGRDSALSGMAKWDDGEEPLETLKFLKEHGRGFDPRIFKVLIRKDPWAAYDWIQENGSTGSSPYGGSYDAMETFVGTIGEQHPDVLARIAELAPAGELRRKMESALFANLLKTDPEAAIGQAMATKGAKVAAERFGAAGLSLVASEPERAFEMAERLLATSPGVLTGMTRVEYPNGWSSSGSDNDDISGLMQALLAKDPARLMAMNPPWDDESSSGSAFSHLASQWAELDVDGYAKWVASQSDPAILAPAVVAVIEQLGGEEQYAQAMDWAMSLDQESDSHRKAVFHQWGQSNPDEALQWLESADLPEDQVNQLKLILSEDP